MKQKFLLAFAFLFFTFRIQAQLTTPKQIFTKADTLRGSNNENRDWWDVMRYDITVQPDFEKKEIEGIVMMKFQSNIDISKEVLRAAEDVNAIKEGNFSIKALDYNAPNDKNRLMQIDLQAALVIDSIFMIDTAYKPKSTEDRFKNRKTNRKQLFFNKIDGVYLLNIPASKTLKTNDGKIIEIYFHGKPREAKKAPWDGGWVWEKDKLGRPFVSVACQGLGASCWFPCKDYQGDEPDNGASLTMIVPDSLKAISNGIYSNTFCHANRGIQKSLDSVIKEQINITHALNGDLTTGHTSTTFDFTWQVINPINSYCIVPYIGNYVNFTDTFIGEKGTLDLSYWVIDYNKEKAQEQFKQVKPMLKAFEYWFGAYPFYEDGYKLVEAPYLGMEHQSAIAYGNGYKNGYKGRDLSGTGWGLKWDFIIVHESGHEWFANSITTKDIADMWVHEGFTNYSEVLFTEYYYGKEAANDYCYGLRKNIANDVPVIGPYGVNKEGSGDMYWKACNMIHSIRNALNDDKKFRKILRGMNEKYYHKTIDGKEIEDYLIEKTGLDLQTTFNQYLRTTQIPTLEYYFKGKKLFYKYTNCVDGFNMPITLPITDKTLVPTTSWQHKRLRKKNKNWFTDKNVERLYILKMQQEVN